MSVHVCLCICVHSSVGVCALNKHEVERVCAGMCVRDLWGVAEHHCAVLVGLAMQYVEQARTRSNTFPHTQREREITLPMYTQTHTHNRKHSSRLP